MGVRMTPIYTFHSYMGSQAFHPVWSNSLRAVNQNIVEVGKFLTKYSVIFGGNSLTNPEPVDSNPSGVKEE